MGITVLVVSVGQLPVALAKVNIPLLGLTTRCDHTVTDVHVRRAQCCWDAALAPTIRHEMLLYAVACPVVVALASQPTQEWQHPSFALRNLSCQTTPAPPLVFGSSKMDQRVTQLIPSVNIDAVILEWPLQHC